MNNQYWQTRVPTTLFEQTQYEADQLFYATFPAARVAACNATFDQSIYDHPSPVDFYRPTLHENIQPLPYPIRNELDINGTSMSFSGQTQELSYPQLHTAYSEESHPHQHFLSHHHNAPSYYSPARPIENEAVYITPKHRYHPYSSEQTLQYIPQSYPSRVPAREPTHLVHHPSHISPQVNTDIQDTVNGGCPETPRPSFQQLDRHMKPPTLKSPNNCQLGVMRLDRLSDRSHLDSPQLTNRSHPSLSETSPVTPSPSTPPLTEFLLNSAPSPSVGLSSLPSRNTPERKPPLACLFCRGRKIACGAPLPGSNTCNQCQKRGLTCYYPTESRRGMRKKKPPSDDPEGDGEITAETKKKEKN